MDKSLFRPEVFEKRALQLEGEVVLRDGKGSTLFVACLLLILIGLGFVLWFGTYSEKVTVRAYVDIEEQLVSVSSSRAGRVVALHTKAGSQVRAGDVLFEMEIPNELHELEIRGLQQRLDIELAQRETTQLFYVQRTAALSESVKSLKRQVEVSRGIVAVNNKQLSSERDVLGRYESLRGRGGISELEIGNQRSRVLSAESQLEQAKMNVVTLEGSLDEMASQLLEVPAKRDTDLAAIDARARQLQVEIGLMESERSLVLRAPISGTVFTNKGHVGGVYPLGAELLTLMPDGTSMSLTLLLPSAAVGFVEPGQTVRMRLDSFPYETFGSIAATISDVDETVTLSKDFNSTMGIAQGDYFVVKAELARYAVEDKGKSYPIRPGMTGQSDIMIRDVPFWEYIVKPLMKQRERA
ncbi:hypothetical protein A3709_20710 [Halioglobus sp. HI00S01]|uniref:HlyD family secretion protein n=1 Tax=Halioglobus sp. HI00S01 TaxID=1822214 RepID=UPI0007C29CF7|nr:HlyD family efflux transporter periplasmic adaptor subunit [Halioglobus sp. HI00S01]KZX58036.1 hypothetical protein A3709_20710 [Halioglobus sp. HI00S01]